MPDSGVSAANQQGRAKRAKTDLGRRAISELIQRRGLSYADAIVEAERRAEAAAAPWREAAEVIRAWREELDRVR